MAEVFVRFDVPILDGRGNAYTANVCGREREDGLWEGWIEFENTDTGETLRSARETTQPNATDLKYWATGLTQVYLEGALARVLKPLEWQTEVVESPVFDGPAESNRVR